MLLLCQSMFQMLYSAIFMMLKCDVHKNVTYSVCVISNNYPKLCQVFKLKDIACNTHLLTLLYGICRSLI